MSFSKKAGEILKGYGLPVSAAAVIFIVCGLMAAGDHTTDQAKKGLEQSLVNQHQISALKKEVENKAPVVPIVVVNPPPVVVVHDHEKTDKPFADHTLLARARRLRDQQQAEANARE